MNNYILVAGTVQWWYVYNDDDI